MSPTDQATPPHPPPPGGEDDIIELTEVVEDAPAEIVEDATAEVVLDFRSGGDDLESLKSLVKPQEEAQEAPPAVPREESLDDFLASLPDLPEDLDIPPETPPLQMQAAQDPRQELSERLSDEELKELVRQVVQETVERMAREVFPEMAAEAIERELHLWKKRLTESD
jgi:hypothetical protein